jgi:hypothetical protein
MGLLVRNETGGISGSVGVAWGGGNICTMPEGLDSPALPGEDAGSDSPGNSLMSKSEELGDSDRNARLPVCPGSRFRPLSTHSSDPPSA